MNFTWFASSYDTDDVPYRLLTMVQMAGVLVLAAGVPAAVGHSDYGIITLGYLIMRIGLVAQWLRAAFEDPASRRTGLRHAAGIGLVELGWLLRLALVEAGLMPASLQLLFFACLVVLELAVEQSGRPVAASPIAIGYAVAIPVGVYLILLRAVHALVGSDSVIPRTAVAGCVGAVALSPLAAPWIGVAAVVALIAAACVALVAVAIRAARS
ncbi:hypothetical protein GCM10009733_107240 [Nonomuraea maheshkhaliensis]|uniref:Low temperature requirement protein A n=1 Tax=Nonomuraea maheshkhaliensis TaxID=419590 RepID=A0ABP4TUB0_9ACTN